MSLNHVGSLFLVVSDLERSIQFYTKALGLVSRGVEDWGDEGRGATLFCNPHPEHAALLTLVEEKNSPISIIKRPILNFNCSNITELHNSLREKGYDITDLEHWDSQWNKHILFDIYDPDGHMINLIQMTPIEQLQEGTTA